jgi:hypothetical protein
MQSDTKSRNVLTLERSIDVEFFQKEKKHIIDYVQCPRLKKLSFNLYQMATKYCSFSDFSGLIRENLFIKKGSEFIPQVDPVDNPLGYINFVYSNLFLFDRYAIGDIIEKMLHCKIKVPTNMERFGTRYDSEKDELYVYYGIRPSTRHNHFLYLRIRLSSINRTARLAILNKDSYLKLKNILKSKIHGERYVDRIPEKEWFVFPASIPFFFETKRNICKRYIIVDDKFQLKSIDICHIVDSVYFNTETLTNYSLTKKEHKYELIVKQIKLNKKLVLENKVEEAKIMLQLLDDEEKERRIDDIDDKIKKLQLQLDEVTFKLENKLF